MHSNHATRAFFKSGTGVVLAVYDARKGQSEGAEAEKVLAFWPPSASPAMQSSIVGLAQALTMFAGTFNKECPFHSMQAHGHSWAMYHAEPDLWLLLLVGRGLVGPHCLPGSLAGCLKGLHALVVLLHGLLSSQQEQDPSGLRLRARLQPLLAQAAASLLTPDACGLWPIACPLGLTGGVPLLPISPAAFTRLQSLANSLLVARLFGSRPVLGLLAAWQGCLLWSSMGSGDTAALASLAVRALEPAAREGPRHKTVRRPLGGAAQHPQQQQQQQAADGSDPHGSSSSICLANPACWYSRQDGLLLPVAAAAGEGSPAGAAAGLEFPEVWLQSGCERQLAGELPAKHLWHVQGLRYLYQDHLAAAVRASPLRKVATLSQPSLHLTADTRRWAALEAAAAVDPTAPALGEQAAAAAATAAAAAAASSQRSSGGGGGADSTVVEQWESFAAGGSDADVEVVVRGANDCWMVGRHTAAGRQLTAAAEGDKDRGMLGFMRRVQTFCDNEVPGVFEGLF
ncbi:hypothetical protein OEZ86_005939 [Tetradesmus obliquus]|nr:hypothetical protein OEZ86_005939 [Tetradesmus obliquus]